MSPLVVAHVPPPIGRPVPRCKRVASMTTSAQVQDIGRFVPVAAYVPGCPPRIEDLIDAIGGLQRKISRNG